MLISGFAIAATSARRSAEAVWKRNNYPLNASTSDANRRLDLAIQADASPRPAFRCDATVDRRIRRNVNQPGDRVRPRLRRAGGPKPLHRPSSARNVEYRRLPLPQDPPLGANSLPNWATETTRPGEMQPAGDRGRMLLSV